MQTFVKYSQCDEVCLLIKWRNLLIINKYIQRYASLTNKYSNIFKKKAVHKLQRMKKEQKTINEHPISAQIFSTLQLKVIFKGDQNSNPPPPPPTLSPADTPTPFWFSFITRSINIWTHLKFSVFD